MSMILHRQLIELIVKARNEEGFVSPGEHRKISKDSISHEAIQAAIQLLAGQVGDNENVIYPFDDLVGSGAMVVPYQLASNADEFELFIGRRAYGNPTIQGKYSTFIGYGEGQPVEIAQSLLRDRGGLELPVEAFDIINSSYDIVDNEFKDGHKTQTTSYAVRLQRDVGYELTSFKGEFLKNTRFVTSSLFESIVEAGEFGQPHEVELIRKIFKTLNGQFEPLTC